MTDYVKAGKLVTDSYALDSTQFSLSDNTLSVGTAGSKSVSGPATNTANYIPQWNGANSALLKDGVELSTDGTLGDNSDTAIPTEKAVKTYVTSATSSLSILDSAVASTTIGNTADETTLYTFSVPANTLGTANALSLKIIGSFLQNASKTCTVKLKYDDTTVATATTVGLNNSATTLAFQIDAYLVAQGTTNSQFGYIRLHGGSYDGEAANAQGTATEDSTGALNLVVTVQWGGANASATLTSKYVILEKITGV